MISLSRSFTLQEATHSATALRLDIDNDHPSPEIVERAKETATHMEIVYAILQHRPVINSWIRCLPLNRALKSKDTSQHLRGEAVDWTCAEYGTPAQICYRLLSDVRLVNYDQLILEHTWIHISWNSIPLSKQRNQVLSLQSNGTYKEGLWSPVGLAL